MEVTPEYLLRIIGEQAVEIKMLREDLESLRKALRRAETKNALQEAG